MSGALAALGLLAFAPSLAATSRPIRARAQASTALRGFGSFTPAAADPRLAAAFARSGVATSGFQFTPSSVPGRRRAVTVAVRARTTQPAADRTAAALLPKTSITPSAYNLGVSVGWKKFAVSGDVAHVDQGAILGAREAVDVGVSYSADRRWTTRFQLGADRSTGDRSNVTGDRSGYSVDLGSSYALTRNLEVTGGVRYRRDRDRLDPVADDRRDSQAVYIGTAFRF